ncbi:hypothetical protein LTR50_005737 [Elasticomyces elasticus]|nr:hypothetical protein LTR50_005737 [Elasticomyces elasticus]
MDILRDQLRDPRKPTLGALIVFAYLRKKLTLPGVGAAAVVGVVHAIHPWNAFFWLLVVFFGGGVAVTGVNKEHKRRLTTTSSGGSGGESARGISQVLANSVFATMMTNHHRTLLAGGMGSMCFQNKIGHSDLVTIGILTHYAAVAADTWSSELGILSASQPRLLPSLRPVPPGTNGAVTVGGLLAGFAGASTIAVTGVTLLPFCPGQWPTSSKAKLALAISTMGLLGSLIDSLLGAYLQASVVEGGRIVEGIGGAKVKIAPERSVPGTAGQKPSRSVISGRDVLSNNGVNLAMAGLTSALGIAGAALYWSL